MKYGDEYPLKIFKYPVTSTYKYASWKDYHTNNIGEGLWVGDKQILGTCQFSVRGCKTEKGAKAKIRKYGTDPDLIRKARRCVWNV